MLSKLIALSAVMATVSIPSVKVMGESQMLPCSLQYGMTKVKAFEAVEAYGLHCKESSAERIICMKPMGSDSIIVFFHGGPPATLNGVTKTTTSIGSMFIPSHPLMTKRAQSSQKGIRSCL